jgi:hypothetical protein
MSLSGEIFTTTPVPGMAKGRAAMQEILHQKEFLQKAQAALEAETEEMYQVSTRLNDNLSKAFKLMWRQLLVIWAVVIVLGISFFLVLGRSSPPLHVDPQELTASAQSGDNPGLTALAPDLPTQNPLQSRVMIEGEKVRETLEQVRKAQLRKDIHLFLNSYSPAFPGLNQKKESILETWRHFDYLDLQFKIENIQEKNVNTLAARVIWDITLSDLQSQEKRNTVKKYTVQFSNSSGKWLIAGINRERYSQN